ncbi:hypothetical protein DWV16_12630 [Anaerotruncus sp. AF02-27]|uniref:hypothetical protein n=1 Tax=Anaerotruncus sp. AF02-27 TaxID=2292191 RepID=UPI000E4960DA|nr:hypothetical protein [Anaerotruncus sp. AF02-27]RGX54767.1 hypothetical protein DWV16_12630 [Anaerotruncus sp. AF02-27]
MKRVLAMILAAALSLSVGITAFAAPEEGDYMTEKEIAETIGKITMGKGVLELNAAHPFDADGKEISDATSDFRSDEDFYVTSPYLAKNPVFNDRDLFKVKFDKDDNANRFRYVLIVEKKFPELSGIWEPYKNERIVAFRFILNETPSDEEFKISGTAIFTAKKDIVAFDSHKRFEEATDALLAELKADGTSGYVGVIKKGTKIEIPVEGFVQNTKYDADYTATAGDGGIVVKPLKNEDSEITWEDANDTLAKLSVSGDNDTSKMAVKLSTKWYPTAPYTPLFANQDAFIRNFWHNPEIPSTSRATLELPVPYVDEDGELTVEEDDIIVYDVSSGQLADITSKGKFVTNDDDELVFSLKTRQLGTYIFASEPIAVPAKAE